MTDIESALVGYLDTELSEAVSTKVPKTRPDTFLRLWRSGGVSTTPVTDAPIVEFEAWGATDMDAYNLGEATRALIGNLPRTQPLETHVYRVREAAGLAYHPDSSGHERYVFAAEIHVRKDQL